MTETKRQQIRNMSYDELSESIKRHEQRIKEIDRKLELLKIIKK
jgi:hypothetical protein